jgi:peptidylprolyl isomerase
LLFVACTPVPPATTPTASAGTASSPAAEEPSEQPASSDDGLSDEGLSDEGLSDQGSESNEHTLSEEEERALDAAEAAEAAQAEGEQSQSEPPDAPLPPPADVAAAPSDAKRTKSGLAYKLLSTNNGTDKPKPFDRVTVHYSGWTTDGNMFDSSVVRGAPAVFGVSQLIVGFTEGLQLLATGDKARFWIPEELAYKGSTRSGAPQGTLVFEVELLSIETMPEPPKPPSDVARPARTAKKTASGLAYKILKRGQGKVHPKGDDVVTVHYTGWTSDGSMFDSSVTRGKPFAANLQNVIKGWSEGVQLLVVGDSARLWIPAALAYGDNDRPGIPKGMLVFDIELLDIAPGRVGNAEAPGGSDPEHQ